MPYTKAPWKIIEKPYEIVGTPFSQYSSIPTIAKLTALDKENAERIVACVNALEGISTDWLMALSEHGRRELIAVINEHFANSVQHQ